MGGKFRRLVNCAEPAAEPAALVASRGAPCLRAQKVVRHASKRADESKRAGSGGDQAAGRQAEGAKERRVVPFDRSAGVRARLVPNPRYWPWRLLGEIPFHAQWIEHELAACCRKRLVF